MLFSSRPRWFSWKTDGNFSVMLFRGSITTKVVPLIMRSNRTRWKSMSRRKVSNLSTQDLSRRPADCLLINFVWIYSCTHSLQRIKSFLLYSLEWDSIFCPCRCEPVNQYLRTTLHYNYLTDWLQDIPNTNQKHIIKGSILKNEPLSLDLLILMRSIIHAALHNRYSSDRPARSYQSGRSRFRLPRENCKSMKEKLEEWRPI